MSLTELVLVVGLWAVWMGVLLATLHRLAGADAGPFLQAPPPRRPGGHRPSR